MFCLVFENFFPFPSHLLFYFISLQLLIFTSTTSSSTSSFLYHFFHLSLSVYSVFCSHWFSLSLLLLSALLHAHSHSPFDFPSLFVACLITFAVSFWLGSAIVFGVLMTAFDTLNSLAPHKTLSGGSSCRYFRAVIVPRRTNNQAKKIIDNPPDCIRGGTQANTRHL